MKNEGIDELWREEDTSKENEIDSSLSIFGTGESSVVFDEIDEMDII